MRTEANKMHKSIPLRKQETHSASLMTDLGSTEPSSLACRCQGILRILHVAAIWLLI